MIITIDGPTASGKTTVARMLAQQLHFYYLSSGLLFRGLAYILAHEFHYDDAAMRNPRQEDIKHSLDPKRFMYRYDAQSAEQLLFDNKNITGQLRDKKITEYASLLGADLIVRNELALLQRHIADHHDLVAEGRDMGSVIFAQADVKFFLTASLLVRAGRWQHDQHAKGRDISLDEAQKEIEDRDERDTNRAIAPLIIPHNAIIIDDSNLSKEEVITLMMNHIQRLRPYA